jgi:alkylated DNA repair dioxygenase AlkB
MVTTKSIDVGGDTSVIYIPGAIRDPDWYFSELMENLEWVQMGNTPRKEYYCSLHGKPYTYGSGRGVRTYNPQPWVPALSVLRGLSEHFSLAKQEVLFLNRYEDCRDQLGWHADDSPEMDDERPITIITLGAERDIMFRPNGNRDHVTRLKLEHGSICIMPPGMQDTHMHRIPKSDNVKIGPRISLTFRGYVNV